MIERDIVIGGKAFHVRFSYRAALLFEDLLREYKDDHVDHPTLLFYCALSAGERFKGRYLDIAYDKFIDWLDEYPEARVIILEMTTEYMMNIAGGEKKKK